MNYPPQGYQDTDGVSIILPGATGGPLYLTKNGAGAPPYSFAGDTNCGLDSSAADTLDLVIGGGSALVLSAAVLRLGLAASATPAAQTLTIGENSRAGTDSNVGGSSGTVRSGLGTGTGTASSLIFQTPDLAASGSGTQSYATRLTIATAAITATVRQLFPDGAQATPAISFTNDADCGFYSLGSNEVGLSLNSSLAHRFSPAQYSLFSDVALIALGSGLDVGLSRKAAGILQLNTGTADAGACLELNEQTAPAAGAANSCRLYCQDNGAGKTQLMAIFSSGSAQQLAIQP